MDPDSIPQNLNFITLNIQQIELLNIATSQTINELLLTTNQIRNLIPEEVKRVIEKNTDINITKETLIIAYKQSMLSQEQAHNNQLVITQKIRHASKFLHLNKENRKALKRAFKFQTSDDVSKTIKQHCTWNYEKIMNILTDFHAVKYKNIENVTLQDMLVLSRQIELTQYLYVDDLLAYTNSTRLDKATHVYHLKKVLDFALKHNKKLILGSFITSTHNSEEINQLKSTKKNKEYAIAMLQNHITHIVKYIHDYEATHGQNVVDGIVLCKNPIMAEPSNNVFLSKYEFWKKQWWNRKNIMSNIHTCPGWHRFINTKNINLLVDIIVKWLPQTKLYVYENDVNMPNKSNVLNKYVDEISILVNGHINIIST